MLEPMAITCRAHLDQGAGLSYLLIERWLPGFVGHLLGDVGNLGSVPRTRRARCSACKIATRRTSLRHGVHRDEDHAHNLIYQLINIRLADRDRGVSRPA
jgi:hypothetical protein